MGKKKSFKKALKIAAQIVTILAGLANIIAVILNILKG